MIYIGLDVHKRFSRMGMFDPAPGDLQDLGEVSNGREALQVRLEQVASPKTVVLEAGRSSYHMAGLVESLAGVPRGVQTLIRAPKFPRSGLTGARHAQ